MVCYVAALVSSPLYEVQWYPNSTPHNCIPIIHHTIVSQIYSHCNSTIILVQTRYEEKPWGTVAAVLVISFLLFVQLIHVFVD